MKGERTIQPRSWEAEHPLSHGQQALWLLHELSPASAAYSLVFAARAQNEVDIPSFRRALQQLVHRHPALRTTFHVRDGKPVQRVHEHMDVSLQCEDASNWSDGYLNRQVTAQVYRPFDLENGPLLRTVLFTRPPQESVLIMAAHHIIADLWSVALFLYELGVSYAAQKAGTSAPLKAIRAQHVDYVRRQEEVLAGPEGERLWSYWKTQLAGDLPKLSLPIGRPRPPTPSYRGACLARRIPQALARQLESLSQAHRIPLHVTLLAAFQTLLYRYTGQQTVLVGSPKAGRSAEFARTIGYFVNPVVLRADFKGELTFSALLDQMGRAVQDAFEHDSYPFPLLVERLQPVHDPSHHPLFQVMFAWQKTTRVLSGQSLFSFAWGEAGSTIDLGGLVLESVPLEQRVVPFDLSLLMAEEGDDLVAMLEYSTDLFDPGTVSRMLDHLQVLLEAVVTAPDQLISALPLLTRAEQQLLVTWNDVDTIHSTTGESEMPSVVQSFEVHAGRTPDAVAAICEGHYLTYGELNRRANRLAHYLGKMGVHAGAVVGLDVTRSLEAIVGLLGTLKAGGVYLPLDPAYPEERLGFILSDARVQVLLTVEQLAKAVIHALGDKWGTKVICLDTGWHPIALEQAGNPSGGIMAQDVAYIIYTSGSTGDPKGILVSHGAIANHCQGVREYYRLSPRDRVLQFASFNFDQSLEQILPTLTTGATLIMRGSEIWDGADFTRLIADLNLSVINLPPAYWHQWIRDAHATEADATAMSRLQSLQLVIVGGDVLLPESLRLWQQMGLDGVRLLNAYGPTETTITATTFEIPSWLGPDSLLHTVPIGRPLPNRRIHILDSRGNSVPPGISGELCIGGAGLALGYLNQPERTAQAFVPDPFSSRSGARLYRTGDMAHHLPDGNVEFLGRVDDQVKIRGFRIELGEIEALLNRHPGVREAVVVVREDPASGGSPSGMGKRLVAYWVPERESALTAGELQRFLRAKLPDYMVPSALVSLAALPRTPSGKVDRRALPATTPDRSELLGLCVAPRTPIEEQLCQLWAEVLGVRKVGVCDNFFDLGGHSLLATQIVSRIRTLYRVELPLRGLFEVPTVEGLATLVTQSLAEQESSDEMNRLLAELESLTDDQAKGFLAGEVPSP